RTAPADGGRDEEISRSSEDVAVVSKGCHPRTLRARPDATPSRPVSPAATGCRYASVAMEPGTPTSEERAKPSFPDFLRYFLGLGTWGFGGPIASVGYMQRDLVGSRHWIDERDFLNGVALGQTMPGPLAA